MALLGSKKKKEDAIHSRTGDAPSMTPSRKVPSVGGGSSIPKHDVLVRPRITEKGSLVAADLNTYLFEVSRFANARDISDAVRHLYKVTPIRVRTLPIVKKSTLLRGKRGVSGGGKKAYVTLNEGDKIEFV